MRNQKEIKDKIQEIKEKEIKRKRFEELKKQQSEGRRVRLSNIKRT